MKGTKKAVVLMLCVGAVAVSSIFGTMAYFTSQDAVENTFTVGDIEIKLDETQVDEYGNPVTPATRTETGNNYKIVPAQTYTKDPTVTVVADSEPCYVRVLVSVGITGQNFEEKIDPIFDKYNLKVDDMFTLNTGWTAVNSYLDNSGENRVYEIRYDTVVDARTAEQTLPPVFPTFTVPGQLNNTEVKTLENLHINVVAQAIQSAGFDDADEAWAAFNSQN